MSTYAPNFSFKQRPTALYNLQILSDSSWSYTSRKSVIQIIRKRTTKPRSTWCLLTLVHSEWQHPCHQSWVQPLARRLTCSRSRFDRCFGQGLWSPVGRPWRVLRLDGTGMNHEELSWGQAILTLLFASMVPDHVTKSGIEKTQGEEHKQVSNQKFSSHCEITAVTIQDTCIEQRHENESSCGNRRWEEKMKPRKRWTL